MSEGAITGNRDEYFGQRSAYQMRETGSPLLETELTEGGGTASKADRNTLVVRDDR